MGKSEFNARVIAATLIFATEVLSKVTLHFTPRDDFYFLVCGIFNIALLTCLSFLSELPVVKDLKVINYVQLVTQLLGWILFSLYFKPTFYNAAIDVLMIAQAIRLLWWREHADRNSSRFWGRALLDRIRANWLGTTSRGKR